MVGHRISTVIAATVTAISLVPAVATAAPSPPGVATRDPGGAGAATARTGDGDGVKDPDRTLGANWRTSHDRAVTTSTDDTGLHILVADRGRAYAWRTAATLREPGIDTDQWIGQLCVTGS